MSRGDFDMKKTGYILGLIFLIAILVSFTFVNILFAQQIEDSQIELMVLDDGFVHVEYKLTINNITTLDIPLIGTPDENLIILVIDESGTPLAYEINKTDNTISIITLESKEVTISYYTQTITFKEGETWTLNLTAPFDTKITLPPNSLVTKISPLPVLVDAKGDQPIFTFNPGNIEIKYIILYPQPEKLTKPATNQTQSQTSKETTTTQPSQTTEPTKTPQENNKFNMTYVVVIIIAIGAIVTILVALKMKGKSFEDLSEEDQEIIKAIEQLGGEAFQSDIQKLVNLPTTTLWRRIKKLEKLGYLRVEKRYGRNYIIIQ